MSKKLKNNKLFLLGIVICFLCIFIGCILFCNQDKTVNADCNTEYTKQENEILKYYHKPKLEENFESNIVNIILRDGYSGKIGFEEFKSVDSISEISAITYRLKTIYKGSNEKFTISEESSMLVLKLSVNDKEKVLEVIEQLQKCDMVLVAEPEYIYETVSDWIPSDAYYQEQWGLHDAYGINIEDAWNITTGSYNVKVGLFENGVEYSHKDLNDHIFIGNHTESTIGEHGTHVAGIIGATQNSYGIAGVSKCSMYMLKRSSFASSLEYAKVNGIKVINASFHFIANGTSDMYAPYNSFHYEAIKEYDGLLVCAAGNKTRNTDSSPMYPACYDLPNVISVGSIDDTGKKSSFSNYGRTSVDIFAPGASILSTVPYSSSSNGYATMSGTSMAAPHVTGVAALMLSCNPDLSVAQIKSAILDSADRDDKLSNLCATGGRLNAYQALLAAMYETNDTGNIITGLNFNPSGELVIPDEINGKTITGIGERAFYNRLDLTSVTIPASITSIENYAFAYCINLERVTFATGSHLGTIGYQAFSCCTSLTQILMPSMAEGAIKIEAQAFLQCYALTEAEFLFNVWSVGNQAFLGCSALTEVEFSSNIVNIGEQAFLECSSLEKVVVCRQNGVITLGDGAFFNTSNNLKIYVADSLYNTYISATNWSGYANKIEKLSLMNIFGQENIYVVSLYGETWEDELFYSEEEIGIGLSVRMFHAYGCLEMGTILSGYDIALSDIQDVYLYAWVFPEYVTAPGCGLYDMNWDYVDWCEISGGMIRIPLMELLTDGNIEFYLALGVYDDLVAFWGEEIYAVIVVA